jgi:hypothetical protein
MTAKSKVEGAFAQTLTGTVFFKGGHIDLNVVQHKDVRPEGAVFRLMRGTSGRGRTSGELATLARRGENLQIRRTLQCTISAKQAC